MSIMAAEGAVGLGKALLDAAGKPILTRETVTERESKDGDPQIVKQGLSITPAGIGAVGAFLWLMGLRFEPATVVDGKGREHTAFRWVARPPATLPNATPITLAGAVSPPVRFFAALFGLK